MKSKNKPKTYNSPILDSLIATISNEELERTENKMRLAVKIADAIEATGLKKSEFAKKINKNNSEISKWLSGTHNFTTDTLLLLQKELGIKLVNSELEEKIAIENVHIEVESSGEPKRSFSFFSLLNFTKLDIANSYSLTA
jgi:ribosome-binding protein aMBF1 (putative translation factor)